MLPFFSIEQHKTPTSIAEEHQLHNPQKTLEQGFQDTLDEEQNNSPDLLPSPPQSFRGEDAQATVEAPAKRRRLVGGLRPPQTSSKRPIGSASARKQLVDDNIALTHDSTPRQLQSDSRALPQRRKAVAMRTLKTPRSATTLIAGIWKNIYGSIRIGPPATFEQCDIGLSTCDINNMNRETFSQINKICLKASKLSTSARALEAIIQAHWMDCYYVRIKVIAAENSRLSPTEAKMAGLGEACIALGWTHKELRNRMTIWRGYKEIKDAGGWVSLVFAGSGIYSTCKYRIGFEDGLIQRLSKLQTCIEVAADTLHPDWRRLLATVGQSTERRYTGHPHDWVVSADKTATSLASTYQQWDPKFSFDHLEECIIDSCWQDRDPRHVYSGDIYTCSECGQQQSEYMQNNRCQCFPSLIPSARPAPAPVQVGRCPRGKNNGLFARCGIERGAAVGEFVGLVTSGIEGMDVMLSGHGHDQYQIYQRRMGNYTRFINHSCAPNSQFAKFVWLGIERILVVSKGIEPGMEITVDYSSSYWTDLEKECLCGESCCRYNQSRTLSVPTQA